MTFFPALLLAAVLGRNEVLVCAVVREAERQGLDPVVVCALVEVESGWNPKARNIGGDHGLFQVSRRWHGSHESVDDNIRTGCSILRKCIRDGSGSVAKGLARYNAGRETTRGKAYARKVLTLAARIKKAVMGRKYHTVHYPCRVAQKDRVYGFQFEWAPKRRVRVR